MDVLGSGMGYGYGGVRDVPSEFTTAITAPGILLDSLATAISRNASKASIVNFQDQKREYRYTHTLSNSVL